MKKSLLLIFCLCLFTLTIRAQDVWLQNHFSPNSGVVLSNNETVNVLINNNSGVVMPSNTITVKYTVDNGVVTQQLLNSNLLPGASWDFTFSTGANLSDCGSHQIKVWVERAGDVNSLNNTLEWTVVNSCPLIVQTGNLNPFMSCAGVVSASQNFSISGTDLLEDITITAPSGYEISTDLNGPYSTIPISLTPSTGTISATNIFVRLTASAGTNTGTSITLTSSSAASKNVAVSGTVNTYPVIGSQPVSKTTCPTGTASFVVTASPATSYQWFQDIAGVVTPVANGGTNPAFSGATSNTLTVSNVSTAMSGAQYYCTVSNGTCAGNSNSALLTVPTALSSSVSAQTDVLCNGTNTGSATVAVTGGTAPYFYAWSPSGGNAATANNLSAQTYAVTITDSSPNGLGGCTKIQTVTISQPSALVVTAAAQTNVNCRGDATGSASVNVTGGTGVYTYAWAPIGGNAATATNLIAGTYTVTVKDANLCSDTHNFTITQPAQILSASSASTGVTCFGGSNGTASVNVTGGTPSYTYQWAPFGGTAASISGRPAGNYTCTIKDAKGCTLVKNITISTPAAFSATVSKTDVSCNGGTNGSAAVTASGGTGPYTYTWAPSGGNAASATGLSAGDYTVTVQDNSTCIYTVNVTIDEPAPLNVTISKTDVLCNGGATGTATVVASGGNGSYTYLWSPSGGTAATATGLANGNYSCLITDVKGCTFTQNITINQPAILTATTSQLNATCIIPGQASVLPSGGAGSYTYLWSPSGATTQTVTGLAAGNQSCLITDANGCTLTKNFTITTTNTLVATASQTNILCNGSNTGSATVIPAGAPGPFTYVWSPSGGNSATASNLTAGNYMVTITSSNGCSIVKNFILTDPTALLAIKTQNNVTTIGGTNGSASVFVTGGTGALTYAWAPSGGTGATANGLAAGVYTVTITDANLCTRVETFTITQPSISATNGVLYVKKGANGNGNSWANALGELSYALKFAKTNNAVPANAQVSQIWVAKGTYKPMYSPADGIFGTNQGRSNAFLMVNNVKLYGGFDPDQGIVTLATRNPSLAATILSGDLNGDDAANIPVDQLGIHASKQDNAYHILLSVGSVGVAELNGFKLTGGNANFGSDITVNGISTIFGSSGGGMFNCISSPGISQTIFSGNSAADIGGGMFNYNTSNPSISQSAFLGNNANYGGGMYNSIASPKLINVSIAGNMAIGTSGLGGGLYYAPTSGGSIVNSILYNNTTPNNANNAGREEIYSVNTSNTKLNIYSSILRDFINSTPNLNYTATQVLTGNPLFTSLSTGDLTLQPNSPAVGSGDNTLYTNAGGNLSTDQDLAGNPRLMGTNIDMGAYELVQQAQSIAAGNLNKTYGDVTFELGATASSGLTVSYVSADNSIAEAYQDAADANKWKINIKKAGTVNITASQAGAGSYEPAPDVVFSLIISPKAVTATIKANAVISKIYNGNTLGTIQVSDLMFATGDILNGDVVSLSLSDGTIHYDNVNAGTNKGIELVVSNMQLSGLQSANYVLGNTGTLSASIGQIIPAALNISANSLNKTYNGAPYNGGNGVSYTGFVNGEDASVLSGTLVYSGTAQGARDVNSYLLTPGGYTSNNYAIAYQDGSLSIAKANLSIVALAKNKVYGDADPELGYTTSGLQGTDGLSGVLARAAGEQVGSYTISIGSLTAGGNYNIGYTPAIFNINAKTIRVTAAARNKTYGDVDPGLTYSFEPVLISGDLFSGSLIRIVGENAGSYSIKQGSLALSNNYILNYTSADFTIVKKSISVTAAAKTKTYGDADPALTYSSTGLSGTDGITGALTRTTGENTGSYAIAQGTVTAGNNYVITYTGANLTVNKAVLNVIAQNVSRCFGQENPSFGLTYSGFKFTDQESSLSAKPTVGSIANTGSSAGNYPVVASGAASDNYNFNYINGMLTIYAKPVPVVTTNRGSSVSRGETVILMASGGTIYTWSNANGIISGQNTSQLTIRPGSTTTYTVTVANANGCSETANYKVEVRDDFLVVKANNLLSPNGDGYNDLWVVENIDMYPNNVVTIFDRAGRVLFTQKSYQNTWDGKLNGSPLAENTYYYVIDFGIDKLKQKGFITLVRER